MTLLARASAMALGSTTIRVVEAADLVLLKLYAGGPQDTWDIDQLLDVSPSIAATVDERIGSLPAECAALWRRIRAQQRVPGPS